MLHNLAKTHFAASARQVTGIDTDLRSCSHLSGPNVVQEVHIILLAAAFCTRA